MLYSYIFRIVTAVIRTVATRNWNCCYQSLGALCTFQKVMYRVSYTEKNNKNCADYFPSSKNGITVFANTQTSFHITVVRCKIPSENFIEHYKLWRSSNYVKLDCWSLQLLKTNSFKGSFKLSEWLYSHHCFSYTLIHTITLLWLRGNTSINIFLIAPHLQHLYHSVTLLFFMLVKDTRYSSTRTSFTSKKT